MVFFLFFFFDLATSHATLNFLNKGLNLHPLQWERGVLTTGPPESESVSCSEVSNSLWPGGL